MALGNGHRRESCSLPINQTGVVITVVLPSGVTYVQGDGGGAYEPSTGVWDVGSIAAGGNVTLSIRVSVDAGTAGTTIVTSAELTAADQTDPELGNNSDSESATVG